MKGAFARVGLGQYKHETGPIRDVIEYPCLNLTLIPRVIPAVASSHPGAVPKSLLFMKRFLTKPYLKTLLLCAAVFPAAVANAADVQQYNIFKSKAFLQSGTGAPIPAGSSSVTFQA